MTTKKAGVNLDNIKQSLVVIGMIASMITAAIVWADSRFSNKDEVARLAEGQKKLEKRVSLNETIALRKEAILDMYFQRDLHRKYPDNQEIKDRLEESEALVKELTEQIKALRAKEEGTGG